MLFGLSGSRQMEHWTPPTEAKLERWRRELPSTNGIAGLTVIDPHDGSDDWAERAAALIHRDGFCAVAHVTDLAALEEVREEAERMVAEVLERDTLGGVNGAKRYSLGGCSATGACLHLPGWASLVGLPVVDAVLGAVWGNSSYSCYGADANFAAPGSGYQALHSDFSAASKRELDSRGRPTAILPLDAPERDDRSYERSGGYHDPSVRISVRDLPCPDVCVNIPLDGFTRTNGPPRLIAGSHHWTAPIPSLLGEPEWMRLSTPCPLPLGSAIFRGEQLPRIFVPGFAAAAADLHIAAAQRRSEDMARRYSKRVDGRLLDPHHARPPLQRALVELTFPAADAPIHLRRAISTRTRALQISRWCVLQPAPRTHQN